MTLQRPAENQLQKTQGHKYEHGHSLVIAGSMGHGGAARLAARAALRIGSGLVTVAPPRSAIIEHAFQPDALMRQPVNTIGELHGTIVSKRITAIAMGPGCSAGRAAMLMREVVNTGLPAVLDADALSALAREPLKLRPDIILTPHRGEFARMFPAIAQGLADTPEAHLQAASRAAKECGATVLLKGPDTAIAAPDGETRLHSAHDVPWLATAGAGDVLTGIIVGLLARGHAPLDAAETGATIHAACARHFGPGLIADDLPEEIPAILRNMA
ncbi:NAD(P)H-hydrate dehydratase [Paracoccus sp. SCSIO 75233]|uniref:NAD(P)H-hydrate dehydratase n=1 Tax=Paracoccus sp. SCSIO 75233 TaxID=3017782 RepID=UPI0022F10756|nr:NAD(P)H-hydrate dehydratase [Paracoccus sp. SCSIO 75233]WBU53292.1 NAD(P)H-hydrate dehydratase [Paracoccus sp. SCSIO 75233]